MPIWIPEDGLLMPMFIADKRMKHEGQGSQCGKHAKQNEAAKSAAMEQGEVFLARHRVDKLLVYQMELKHPLKLTFFNAFCFPQSAPVQTKDDCLFWHNKHRRTLRRHF